MQHTKPMKQRRGRRYLMDGAVALCMLYGSGVMAVAMLSTPAHAESDAVKELAAPPPIELPLKPGREFAKFPRYVGMLGNRQIVLRLGPKSDDPSGVHGEYQFTDNGAVILIAGDRDGDTLEVEESNDGTHITGNWVGKFAARHTRRRTDESGRLRSAAVRSASAGGGPAGAAAGRCKGTHGDFRACVRRTSCGRREQCHDG
jgi:hypothetical protein